MRVAAPSCTRACYAPRPRKFIQCAIGLFDLRPRATPAIGPLMVRATFTPMGGPFVLSLLRRSPDRYAPRSNRCVPAPLGPGGLIKRRRDNSSRRISRRCEFAGLAILRAFSLAITSRSSTGRVSQPGSSPCRCTAARATSLRPALPPVLHFQILGRPSVRRRRATSCRITIAARSRRRARRAASRNLLAAQRRRCPVCPD